MKRFPARSFRDLIVWQKSHRFVLLVYRYTKSFPKGEIYGVSSQFRRSAISIPANIAEGLKKRSRIDKARFMNDSQGSLEECRYYLILAADLGYGTNGPLLDNLEEVSKLLEGYSRAILANNL